MKSVCWGENLSKLSEPLPGFRSRLFENQGAISFFIFHSSLLRLHRDGYRLFNAETLHS
jgi:hypothetical protein